VPHRERDLALIRSVALVHFDRQAFVAF
jgi:hypothetical protein